MAGIARILPRDWDGRRLLQFLAGLALIALSFAVHLGVGPAAPSAAAYTAVGPGASAPGASASGSSASGQPAGGAVDPTVGDARPAGGAATTRHPTTATVAGAAGDRPAAADSSAQAVAGPAFTAVAATAVRSRTDGNAVLPTGAARGVLGSRAPPRG